MKSNRRATKQEEQLIELLIQKASLVIPADWKDMLTVRPMDDGGMGSLCLFPQGTIVESRVMGEQVSEYQYTDIDGVEVIVSLNVDSQGRLFELDIWKTDFGEVKSLPIL